MVLQGGDGVGHRRLGHGPKDTNEALHAGRVSHREQAGLLVSEEGPVFCLLQGSLPFLEVEPEGQHHRRLEALDLSSEDPLESLGSLSVPLHPVRSSLPVISEVELKSKKGPGLKTSQTLTQRPRYPGDTVTLLCPGREDAGLFLGVSLLLHLDGLLVESLSFLPLLFGECLKPQSFAQSILVSLVPHPHAQESHPFDRPEVPCEDETKASHPC